MSVTMPWHVARESLAEVIADFNACGSCASAPPYCSACQGEADAILARFVVSERGSADT